MTFKEFSGKNVEEAIRAAMKEFGADLGDLDIEILAQGSRGILGVGSDEARILAAPKSAVAEASSLVADAPAPTPAPARGRSRTPAPEPQPDVDLAAEMAETAEEAADAQTDAVEVTADAELVEAGGLTPVMADEATASADGPSQSRGRSRGSREGRAPRESRPPRSDDPRNGDRPEPRPFVPAKPMDELSESERATVDEAKSVLEELLRLMEIQGTVEVTLGTEAAKLNVIGDDLGILIGRRGEKLASLQHIVNLIVARREGQLNRIMIDVENYRGRREDQLRDVADRAAKRVSQSGKIIQLEAMPAMERRIVHLALSEHDTVRTQSVGVEPNRRVVILPANKVT
jgi:spoIIIJ-associated protein